MLQYYEQSWRLYIILHTSLRFFNNNKNKTKISSLNIHIELLQRSCRHNETDNADRLKGDVMHNSFQELQTAHSSTPLEHLHVKVL